MLARPGETFFAGAVCGYVEQVCGVEKEARVYAAEEKKISEQVNVRIEINADAFSSGKICCRQWHFCSFRQIEKGENVFSAPASGLD